MQLLAVILRLLAKTLLRQEWARLRVELKMQHSRLQQRGELSPPLVAQCLLVSGEDHRHRRHPGFDIIAIGRALWRGVFLGIREGASTIEQQVVRVLTGRYERTLARKIREILLATLVTEVVAKRWLPAIYLEIGYFGWRMNGFQQACGRLRLQPQSLSLEDAAHLVARLKYPEPSVAPPSRWAQIHGRARHLQALYHRHLYHRTYEHLGRVARAETVLARPLYAEASRTLP